MRNTRMLLAALLFTTLLSGVAAAAPTLDSAGKCRDNGKFVAASLCQTAAPAAGKCRNVKTKKFAKCGTPGTEPVPTSTTSSAPTGTK